MSAKHLGVASRYFLSRAEHDSAEMSVCDMLNDIIGPCLWEDFTADPYDDSIEIFGVAKDLVLSEEQRAALWLAGFKRCWTHTTEIRVDNHPDEKYYASNGATRLVGKTAISRSAKP